jgi:hypothetical protein
MMQKRAGPAKAKIGVIKGAIRDYGRRVLSWRSVLRPILSRRLLPSLLFLLAAGAGAIEPTPKLVLGGYEQSLRLLEQGECEKAQERLAPDGRTAAGYEVALLDIGNCYRQAADKISDPDLAQRTRELGAGWVLFAANAGVRRAQEEAVRLYLDGQIFIADPYEAGKWFLLWSSNRSQMQLGQVEFDADLMKQINASFTPEHWAEAKARAAKWRPVTSSTTAP